MTIDLAFLQERFEDLLAQEAESGTPYGDYYKPEAAPLGQPARRNKARMLPPHPNMLETGRDGVARPFPIIWTKVHYGLGPLAQKVGSPCLEFFGLPCPACEYAEGLRQRMQNDPALKDLYYGCRSKVQYYANVVNILDPSKGVQTWRFGKKVYERVRSCFYDSHVPPHVRDITDMQTGHALILDAKMVKGRGNNPYPEYETIRADDQPLPMDASWLEQIRDLRAQEIYCPTADQVRAAVTQGTRVVRQGQATLVSGPSQAMLSPAPGRAVNITPVTPFASVYVPQGGTVSVPQVVTSVPASSPTLASPAPQETAQASPPAPAGKKGKVTGKKKAPEGPPAVEPPVDPLALAEAEVLRLGAPIGFVTLAAIPFAEIDLNDLPGCYGLEQDVTDANCQICPAIIACRAVMMGLIKAA